MFQPPGREPVAEAANRVHEPVRAGGGELAAEVRDVLVDEPRLDRAGVDAPHLEQQVVARVDPAGVLGERREQAVLEPRQQHLGAVDEHAVGVVLDHERPARRSAAAARSPSTMRLVNAFTFAASTFGDTGFTT